MQPAEATSPATFPLEGEVSVPGGVLRYRVAGRKSAGPWLVFENGWGASFPHLFFMEHELAPYARLLFYDRAGIGESRRGQPQSVSRLTGQLLALLSHLGIGEPVVVVGQSYGGLMAALHAAQAPAAIQSIIQIDPTPEYDDAVVDAALGSAPVLIGIIKACVRLGLPDMIFSSIGKELPPEVFQRVLRQSFQSIPSINASIDELKLLPDIRQTIARLDTPRRHPRLVISAAQAGARKSLLLRLLVSEAKAKAMLEGMQGLHRRQAASSASSRWQALSHNHSGLVMTAAGASDVARSMLGFLTSQ